jgi:hypothetical protein
MFVTPGMIASASDVGAAKASAVKPPDRAGASADVGPISAGSSA